VRGSALLAVALALAASRADVGAAEAQASEDEVKAAFVYQFTRFVEWPDDRGAAGAFVVAVVGTDLSGAAVERALAGKKANEPPIAGRRLSELPDAAGARILFVGASEEASLARILAAVDGRAVLTVGESPDFAQRGGMIGFRTVDKRVRFEINAEEAAKAGLKISSEVLKLARLVRTRSTP
jgi:hypothetical protein